MDKYNIVIIGGGPAGLTAGVYARRAGAKVLIIEKMACGGKVNLTDSIENFMGFLEISGAELAGKMRSQAKKAGVNFMYDTVVDIEFDEKKVVTESGEVMYDALIIAGGTINRQTGLSSEQKFIGQGVSYCAVCDGMFYKDKEVAVLGGGNTAFRDALYLKNICKKVYLIHRRTGFRAEPVLVERLKECDNVEFVLNSTISDIKGENTISSIVVKNTSGEEREIEVSGLFVALGILPDTKYLEGKIHLNKDGYIVTNERMETSVKGVYAAGDIRETPLRQIVTACADGAVAAEEATLFISLANK